MLLLSSLCLTALAFFLQSAPIYGDHKTCIIVVKTSQYLKNEEASNICRTVYNGRLLNITLTYSDQDIEYNITMRGSFWIDGRLSDGSGKCSVMRCKNTKQPRHDKRKQCKCKFGMNTNRKISNYVCETECSKETTTYLTDTLRPLEKTTLADISDAFPNNTTNTIVLSENATKAWKEPFENTIHHLEKDPGNSSTFFFQNAVTDNVSSSDTITRSDSMTIGFENLTETSGLTSNSTFDNSSTSFVVRSRSIYLSVSAKSSKYTKQRDDISNIQNYSRNTKVSSIGWIVGGVTTAVNLIIILALFVRRWRNERRNKPRQRFFSGVSTSSFSFRSTQEQTDNQATLRPQSAPVIPLIRLSSTYELAGCVQRCSTPLISEMSSTSRYAACYDGDRSPSNFSAHAQSCASYLSVNDRLSRDAAADDYYKLEKLKVPYRRSRSSYSTARRSKTSLGSSKLSKSLSDISTLVPYSFPKKRLCVSDRIAFDVADDDHNVLHSPTAKHIDRSISKLFSESEPHLINSDVLFQFQLSWETDSESYFMEVETSSFVDNILSKISEPN